MLHRESIDLLEELLADLGLGTIRFSSRPFDGFHNVLFAKVGFKRPDMCPIYRKPPALLFM